MDGTRFVRRLVVTFAVIVTVYALLSISSGGSKPPRPHVVAPPSQLVASASSTTAPTTTTTASPIVVAPAPAVSGCFADLAAKVGWPSDAISHLTAIIERESHCDPNSNTGYRPSTGDWSLGLLQINTLGALWESRAAACGLTVREDLLNPETNLRCGLVLYRDSGFGPWGG